MPYDSLITRADADALIPEQIANSIVTATVKQSAALQLCKRVAMSNKQLRQPVLDSLMQSYWVAADTGLKSTADAAWAGVELVAEEIAIIVPVPEAVLADATFGIWAALMDPITEAFGARLDAAVLSGVDKPTTWPDAIVPSAIAAGNVREVGTSTPPQGGISGDMDALLGLVEASGHDVTGVAARASLRALLRGARDTTGQPLQRVQPDSYFGVPLTFGPAGTIPAPTLAVAGDWSMALLAVRQDMTYKYIDQGVISDETGKIILNFSQNDSIGLRVTARFGFAVANPAVRLDDAVATPYPFAVLQTAD